MPQTQIQHESGIDTRQTLVDWCNFCREECTTALGRTPIQIGGIDENSGLPIIVEVDESKYFHRKYHRGTWREGHWVFGGVERGSERCFLLEVEDRRANTLLALIQQHILPGTYHIGRLGIVRAN